MSDLSELLSSLEGLGQEVLREVPLGDFKFGLCPLASEDEIEAYLYAEEISRGESKEFQLTPSYVHLMRKETVIRSIRTVNGYEIKPDDVIENTAGEKVEGRAYLRKIVGSWPAEVVEYFFVEYNRLQIDMSHKYSFKLTHRSVMGALDNILRVGAELALSSEALVEDNEDLKEEENGEGREVSQPEDSSEAGVLDSDGAPEIQEVSSQAGEPPGNP